jgi:hypothetical protein
MVDETAHILAADQRNVLAEFRAVEFEQALAMSAFLLGHLGKDMCAGGVFGSQAFGNVGIDAVVLFLVGDRQCEDLPLRQVGKIAHGRHIGGWRPGVKWVSKRCKCFATAVSIPAPPSPSLFSLSTP